MLVLAGALLLAGCYGEYVQDYRELYPIRVQTQTAALPVAFAASRTEPGSEQLARLDAFLADFRARGGSKLFITANPAGIGEAVARDRARTVERRAVALGISPAAIETRLLESPSRPGEAIVSYEQSTVQVPECGDWSKNTAVDGTNSAGSNFGCATQRYIGLMAADPADLVRPREYEGHDGQRTVDVMQKYRTGRQTGAAPPVGQPATSQSFGTGGQ
jgi:pilus assembly protein CpaD